MPFDNLVILLSAIKLQNYAIWFVLRYKSIYKTFFLWFVYHFPEIMSVYAKHLSYSQQQQAPFPHEEWMNDWLNE